MENVSGSLLASDAVGWKLYAVPLTTVVAGVPEIVGAVFVGVGAVTVMVNAASDVLTLPSFTLMMMLLYVPALVGVPVSLPVVVLNVVHDGAF